MISFTNLGAIGQPINCVLVVLQELTGVSLAELQTETSPRISGGDLVELLNTKFSRPKVFIIDIREHFEYPFSAY